MDPNGRWTSEEVGQLRDHVLRLGSTQHLAMQFALEEHGGFLGIAVDIPQAMGPRVCKGRGSSFEEEEWT